MPFQICLDESSAEWVTKRVDLTRFIDSILRSPRASNFALVSSPRSHRCLALHRLLFVALTIGLGGCVPLLDAYQGRKSGAAVPVSDLLDEQLDQTDPPVDSAEGQNDPADAQNDSADAQEIVPVTLETFSKGELELVEAVDSQGYTLAEVVVHARANHPQAIAAARRVDAAKVNVKIAGEKANPEFVIDYETPVYDQDDSPSEISTRLTLPIFQGGLRRARLRRSNADVVAALASHELTLRTLGDEALAAAIRLSYLQEKSPLLDKAVELAKTRRGFLAPQVRAGAAGENYVDFTRATSDLQKAKRDSAKIKRELAIARIRLAEAMGMSLEESPEMSDALFVRSPLGDLSLELPPLESVIERVLQDSAELSVASSAVERAWGEQRTERDRKTPMESGPLYQDRLGEDNDNIGIRFQADIPLHTDKKNRVLFAGINAQVLEGDYQVKRHELATATAREFRELELLALQLSEMRSDNLIEEQSALLEDNTVRAAMSGEQLLRVQQAVLEQRIERLDLEYRYAALHASLRLHSIQPDAWADSVFE